MIFDPTDPSSWAAAAAAAGPLTASTTGDWGGPGQYSSPLEAAIGDLVKKQQAAAAAGGGASGGGTPAPAAWGSTANDPARDPSWWTDQRAKSRAAVQSINNAPYTFSAYTQPDGTANSADQMKALFYPGSQPAAAAAPSTDVASALSAAISASPMLAALLGGLNIPSLLSAVASNPGGVGGLGGFSGSVRGG
jgi:hypothetical protein